MAKNQFGVDTSMYAPNEQNIFNRGWNWLSNAWNNPVDPETQGTFEEQMDFSVPNIFAAGDNVPMGEEGFESGYQGGETEASDEDFYTDSPEIVQGQDITMSDMVPFETFEDQGFEEGSGDFLQDKVQSIQSGEALADDELYQTSSNDIGESVAPSIDTGDYGDEVSETTDEDFYQDTEYGLEDYLQEGPEYSDMVPSLLSEATGGGQVTEGPNIQRPSFPGSEEEDEHFDLYGGDPFSKRDTRRLRRATRRAPRRVRRDMRRAERRGRKDARGGEGGFMKDLFGGIGEGLTSVGQGLLSQGEYMYGDGMYGSRRNDDYS